MINKVDFDPLNMAFNRFDDRRSTYNFEKTPSRGRAFFRGDSPLFRRKPFLNGNASVPSSVASSRESSLDRTQINNHDPGTNPNGNHQTSFHQVVGRVMSSPRMSLRQKFQVMRSGSFNSDTKSENKRKKWLVERSGSLRLPGRYHNKTKEESPWSSPEADRRGSLPMGPPGSPYRDRSLDRVQLLERRGSFNPNSDLDSGKIKGFVNR